MRHQRRKQAKVAIAVSVLGSLLALVPAAERALADVFPGATERVPSEDVQSGNGLTNPTLSSDGRYVVFMDGSGHRIWRKDRRSSSVPVLVNVTVEGQLADNVSSVPTAISSNGRYVAFVSWATDLVPDDRNNAPDIFVRDVDLSRTERVSVSTAGNEANAESSLPFISNDGRYIAFTSRATNLVTATTEVTEQVYVKDTVTGAVRLVSTGVNGPGTGPSLAAGISDDGTRVVFESEAANLVSGDDNERPDPFLNDFRSGELTRVVADNGNLRYGGGLTISSDGEVLAFVGTRDGLPCCLLLYRPTAEQATIVVDQPGIPVFAPSLSADGGRVAFAAVQDLTDEVPENRWQIYLRDDKSGSITIASVNNDDSAANVDTGNSSTGFRISRDGLSVAFESFADNLVPGDTNNQVDVFIRGPAFSSPPISNTEPYVALGDSFSSGEGTGNYALDTESSACHRGPHAWPRLLADSSPEIEMALHLACSGARIADLFGPQPGATSLGQLDRLSFYARENDVKLVTVTIGGNDLNFVQQLSYCVATPAIVDHLGSLLPSRARLVSFGCLTGVFGLMWRIQVQQVADDLGTRVYPAIKVAANGGDAANGAEVVVVGYPRLFPNRFSEVSSCRWLSEQELIALNKAASFLDEKLSDAAEQADVKYISVLNALQDRELCTSNSAVSPITPLRSLFNPWSVEGEQGHPMLAGQAAIADLVARSL